MVTPRRGTAVSAFPVWGGACVGLLRGGPGPAAPRRGRGARADHCPLGADMRPPARSAGPEVQPARGAHVGSVV